MELEEQGIEKNRRTNRLKREKARKVRNNTVDRVISILYSLAVIGFVGILAVLGVLPLLVFVLCIALVLVGSIFIVPVLYSERGIPSRKKKVRIVACVLIPVLLLADYYMASTLIFLNHISNYVEAGTQDRTAFHVDVQKERFNVLVSGIDVTGDINDTVSRSDVNMVLTVNPNTREVLITSIPRDSYISLPSYNSMDKLTHTGIYGTKETIGAVESLLDIEINYYVKVNYTTVTGLVDAIGGIDIVSPYSFDTHGMKEKYHFDEGEIHLDGSHALAYCRERKSWADGDMKRNENQQLVLEAIINKLTKTPVLLLKYTTVLNAVKGTVETDMEKDTITDFVRLQLKEMSSWQITKQALKGESKLAYCYSLGASASVVVVDETGLQEAKDCIEDISIG